MRRTQIMLAPEEHRRASEKAAESGVSLAEYIRRLVRADTAPSAATNISAIFDLGDSGGSDIAKHKREYIGDAVEAEYLRDKGER